MPGSEYWKRRMLDIEEQKNQKSIEYVKAAEKQFEIAKKNIEKDMAVWYARLADNNEISLAEAKKLLDKNELEEFHWNVEEYIKKGELVEYHPEWEKQLENASAKVHIRRLEALKLQLQQETETLYGQFNKDLGEQLKSIYSDGYYHTAFEIQKGNGVGYALNQLDSRKIDTALKTAWAQDGKNFSDRIWKQKEKLVAELNTVLVQNVIRGKDVKKSINDMAKRLDVSKAAAGRIIMTEAAAIHARSQQECYKELGVEEFEFLATLDWKTSQICREMDGRHFKMSEYEIGSTVPPLHPWCRSTTVPYFPDDGLEENEKRAARGEDGKTYLVPGNMTYGEWQKMFVKNKEGLTPEKVSDKIMMKGVEMVLEYQRYGRNKGTLVNSTYINGGDYRNKFDNITENADINRVIYSKAKEMLKHRSGTMFEDMYWLDGDTGKIVASALEETVESAVIYSNRIDKEIRGRKNLIAMHTHPNSMPPSISDINSSYQHDYLLGIVICHNGTIYAYRANQSISQSLYEANIAKYLRDGHSELEAQLMTLEKFKCNYDIDFWEVK